MNLPLKTPEAARSLGVPHYILTNLIRYGKVTPPEKDSSGDYLWTEPDLERARVALAKRKPRQVKKEQA